MQVSSCNVKRRRGKEACAGAARAVIEGLEPRTFLSAYTLQTLVSFTGPNGAFPEAPLVFDSSGNLFSTTADGGANSDGTVFEIPKGTTKINTIASFDGSNGSFPAGGVTFDSNGNLFGTTVDGGFSNFGVVFEIPKGTTAITMLDSFNGPNGANPQGGLVFDSSGNLFGDTSFGGANNGGAVFEIVNGTTTIVTVDSFNSGITGANPQGSVIFDSSGNLFGTTVSDGGANSDGTVFEIAKGTTNINAIASFAGANGAFPSTGLFVDASGTLFGTTEGGGDANSDGIVFSIAQGTTIISTIASFNGANGRHPQASVIFDSSGNLFGTTGIGGANNSGTVFEIAQGATSITTLTSFDGTTSTNPVAALAIDSIGDIFGTTQGGEINDGNVFELFPSASQLAFGATPPPAMTGAVLSPAVTVNVEDVNGNVVTKDASTVTLSIASGPGGATLGGTLSAMAVNGVATFSNLTLDKAGNYTLKATDAALTMATSMSFTISPTPTKLAFPAPPSNVVVGAAIAPAVAVTIEDAGNNVVPGNTSTVTLSIASGPTGAVLGGTLSVMAVNGVATFSNLTLNKVGAYTLKATDGSLTSVTSMSFMVAQNKVVFTAQPSPAVAGAAISPAVTVSVEDAASNVVVADHSTVTLSIASGPAGATLGGTLSAMAVNGVATFANLSLNEAGPYTLKATDGMLTSATSISFVISPPAAAPAAKLAFAQPPTPSVVATALSPAVIVSVEDASGNIVVTDNSRVTLAIASGTTGATLGGTLSVMAVNGIATFSDLTLDQPGTYMLIATDAALTSVTSAGFSITPVGALPAAGLAFTATPATAVAAAVLSPAVTVNVEDANGAVVPSDSSTITLALASGPAGAVLGGALSVAAVNGIATFSNLSLNLAGDYTFTATDGTLNAATSNTITVFLPAKIGGLDPTFGFGGIASHDVGLTSTAGLAVQGDGKSIIVGSTGSAGSHAFGLTRFNADGSVDSTFGTNGFTQTPFPGDVVAAGEVLLTNGDILVAGTDTTLVNGQSTGSQFALAEYTSAGALDTTFGNGAGFVLTSFSTTAGTLSNDVVHAIVVGADGTIYLGGSSDAAGHGQDFAVAVYTPSGSASAVFGTNGKVLLDFIGGNDSIAGLALGLKGTLIAGGSAVDPANGVSFVALAEFLPTGALDTKFGNKGKVTTGVGGVADAASSLAVDKKGNIVAGGYTATGSAAAGTLSANFLLLRYAPNGKLDRTFGNHGIVDTSFNQPAAITSVLIDADGTIVASGKTTASLANLDPTALDVAVARYTAKGQLDTTFNGTGQVIVNLSTPIVTASLTTPGSAKEQPAFEQLSATTPFDTTSDLMANFMQLTQSVQGVIVSDGGELFDVGTSGTNTVEAAIISMGLDLAAAVTTTLPPSVVGGGKGTISVNIAEVGTELASGTFAVELFASSSQFLATDATPFQSFPEKLKLKANKSKSLHLKFVYPSSLSEGNYFIVATVVPGTARDLNIANNTSVSAAPVMIAPPFVHLAGGGLTAPVFTGTKPATVSFTITNTGNVTASVRSSVQFFASIDGKLSGAIPLAVVPLPLKLKPATPHAFKLKLSLPTTVPAGTYMLLALLDPANVFQDPNAATNFIVSGNTFVVG